MIKKVLTILAVLVIVSACSGGKYLFGEDKDMDKVDKIDKTKVTEKAKLSKIEKDILNYEKLIKERQIVIDYTQQQIDILDNRFQYFEFTRRAALRDKQVAENKKAVLERQLKKDKK